MDKVLGFIIYVILLGASIWFFDKEKLKSPGFVSLVSIISILMLALNGFERLKEFNLKEQKLVLNDIKETRDEVYAKAEEVRQLMGLIGLGYVDIAHFDTDGAVSSLDPNIYESLRYRERAKIMFSNANWDDNQIEESVFPINDDIFHLLACDLRNAIFDSGKVDKSNKEAWDYCISILQKTDFNKGKQTLELFELFLKEHEIPEALVHREIERLRYFYIYKNLPDFETK